MNGRLIQAMRGVAVVAVMLLVGACSSQSSMVFAPEKQAEPVMAVGAYGNAASAMVASAAMTQPAVSSQARPSYPGGLPARDEEIWVIQKPASLAGAPKPPGEKIPGTGALMMQIPGQAGMVAVAHKHTDVNASIVGNMATVDVAQQFVNNTPHRIDAVYAFPLPEDAGVADFVMTMGSRRIRGVIRERAEAEQIYREAKAQGYVVSLLTQGQANMLTQAVANIEPGQEIDVALRYYQTLAYRDGWFEFVFPLRDGSVGASPSAVGELSLHVQINAGAAIEELLCPTHTIERRIISPARTQVRVADASPHLDKDLVLRYRVAAETVKSTLLAGRATQTPTGKEGFFSLMLYPPLETRALARRPLEVIFVIDAGDAPVSATMAQLADVLQSMLRQLTPDDTFCVIDDGHGLANPTPRAVTVDEIKQVSLTYLNGRTVDHGALKSLRAAIELPPDPKRTRVLVLMTADEVRHTALLPQMRAELARTPLLCIGIGATSDHAPMEEMARMAADGAVAYLPATNAATTANGALSEYLVRVAHPALTDVSVDYGTMQVRDVFPQHTADLYVGRPLILTGRYSGLLPEAVTVHGQAGDRLIRFTIPIQTVDCPALPFIWARRQLADYYDRSLFEPGPWPDRIRQIALQYGLLSPYTAFLAVDATRRTTGE